MNILVLCPFLLLILRINCVIHLHRNRKEANDETEPQIWALLVAGSTGWNNYRHQADVCHSYQVLRNHGIPQERIVTMMYDDIAYNRMNPYPGEIFNRPNGANVYEGIIKDYTSSDITVKNFLNILQGNKMAMQSIGSGKVIESGPNDHIFVFFADHGANGLIVFPREMLHVRTLNQALVKLHVNKKFKQLVFYLEACESGSMFRNILRNDISTYAITAANYHESSWGCYCENDMHLPCMGDLFSVNWMEDSDSKNLTMETLLKQFKIVKNMTDKSHVEHFGNLSIANEPVADFQGYDMTNTVANSPSIVHKSPWSAHEIPLKTLYWQKQKTTDEGKKQILTKKINRLLQKRKYLEDKMVELVSFVIIEPEKRLSIMRDYPEEFNEIDCHFEVTHEFHRKCFSFAKNPYAAKFVFVLTNLCEEGIDSKRVIFGIHHVCNENNIQFGGIH